VIPDPDCFLCSDLSDRNGSIAVTAAFQIAADIAPLNRDHCLFYTTKHDLSFSGLSRKMLRGAADALASLSTLPMFSKKEVLYFEHGPSQARIDIVGCCNHAHIHILPTVDERGLQRPSAAEVCRLLLEREERAGKIRFTGKIRIEELEKLKGQNYFWIATNIQALQVFAIVQPERQYLRHVAALLLGLPKYQTWELYDDDAAKRTTQKLRSEIRKLRESVKTSGGKS
jgi:hypothetical protein